jgi:hypothetical protein
MRSALGFLAGFGLLVAATPAAADPILAPPGAPNHDAALAALADAYQRQQLVLSARESGVPLDTFVVPGDVQAVRDFFKQPSDDFQKVTGKHPFAVVSEYGEHGDMGNFSGIGSVGIAARLIVLRAAGAPAAELDAARAAAVRAARTWHAYGAIGGAGVVARGVRRRVSEVPGDPPLPGKLPELVPLADGSGNALPAKKQPSWRAAVDPAFGEWIWFDDTSKDQVSGYALGAAWLWDALHDDPAVPAEVPAALAADLRNFALALMQVAPETVIDLCIRDADGRLTSFSDLNPRQLGPTGIPLPEYATLQNGFNAALALGIVRAAYHASGDEAVGRFYYDELVRARDLPGKMLANSGAIFLGAATNYSNVNMLAIALATLGRFETDPEVRATLEQTIATQFWSTNSSRDVSHVKQAWFDAIVGAYSPAAAPTIPARIRENLGGFNPVPAFQRDRVNCDDAEIQKGECLAVDGKTVITLHKEKGWGGGVVAVDIVPMAVRPDSDFMWRSDPHQVNGYASNLLDSGGDFLAAYWLARSASLGGASNNVSPAGRPPVPPAADPMASPPGEDPASGCHCHAAGSAPQSARPLAAVFVAAALLAFARRRHRG